MMKVAFFTGLRALEVLERPRPVLERPGDVLVRIDTLGVCGSDIHYYTAGRIGGQVIEHPATLGHECAGTVAEVGTGVDRLAKGQRVAIELNGQVVAKKDHENTAVKHDDKIEIVTLIGGG